MKHVRERFLMAAGLLGLPALIVVFGILPQIERSRKLRAQIQTAHDEFKVLPQFTPLSHAEKEQLEDPAAPWRFRLPVIVGDRARLDHYHRVIGELQDTLRARGIAARGMRSSWDPIKASFSVPGGMGADPKALLPAQDAPELKVKGWVLEVDVPGATSQLFHGLGTVHRVGPILEPVGLRWEAGPEIREQKLLLRNLVLVP